MFFSKQNRDIRTVWGYTFEWTPEHKTKEQLRPLTYSYDVLASECLDRLDQLSPPPSSSTTPPRAGPETPVEKLQDEKPEDVQQISDNKDPESKELKSPSARRDLYALLATHHATDATLAALWSQLHTIPPWVDWEQIARGQAVFYRYGGPAIVSLTFQSLVGGMAGWRVVETLARTGGFNAKVAKHRLLETFQHVLQVTKDLQSVQPGGEGFAASVRVRLLHASVRRRILSLAKEREGYFDVEEWGVPINDLDSLGTVLSFSAALVWIGLPRQGIYLRPDEIADYHALWRWVAHLLGAPSSPSSSSSSSSSSSPTDTDDTTTDDGDDDDGTASSSCPLADWRASKVFLESLIVAELAPSAMSGVLANNILTALSDQPPAFASRAFMCAEARWLNGAALCDALGIARPGVWYRLLVGAQCVYFMGVCYVKRAVPAWDRESRERIRRIFYKMTVENKEIGLGQETIFDFKYVPQIGLTTPLGDVVGAKAIGGGGGGGRPDPQSLVTLVAVTVTALAGTVAWLGLRSALRLVGLS